MNIVKENAINAKYDSLKAGIEAREVTEGYTQADKDKEIAEIEIKEITDEYTQEDKDNELAAVKAKPLIAAYTKADKQNDLAENEALREAELKKIDDDFESELDNMINKGSSGFSNDYITTVIENLDFSTPDPVEIDNDTIEDRMYKLSLIADNCKYVYLTMPNKYEALNELSDTEYNKYSSAYDAINTKYDELKASITAKEITDEYTQEDKDNELANNETARDAEIKTLNDDYMNTMTTIGVALTALKTDNETGFNGDVHVNGKLHVDEDVNLEGKLNNIAINDILTQEHLTAINTSIASKANSTHEHVTTDVFGLNVCIDDIHDQLEGYGSYIAKNTTNIKSNTTKITDIETSINTINTSLSNKADSTHTHTLADIEDYKEPEAYDDTTIKADITSNTTKITTLENNINTINSSLSNKVDRNISIGIKASTGGADNAIIFGPLTSMIHFKGYIDILREGAGCSSTVELEYNVKEKKMNVLNLKYIQGGNMKGLSWWHKYPLEIRLYKEEPYLLYHQYSCHTWLGNNANFVGIGNITKDNFKIVSQSSLSIPEEETITVIQTTNEQDRVTALETNKADSTHKHKLADIEDYKEAEAYDDTEIKADIANNTTKITNIETNINTINTSIANNTTNINTNTTNITNIQNTVNEHTTQIANKADSTHKHKLADIEDYKAYDDTEIKANIASNTTNITNIQNTVNEHTTQIADINNKITSSVNNYYEYKIVPLKVDGVTYYGSKYSGKRGYCTITGPYELQATVYSYSKTAYVGISKNGISEKSWEVSFTNDWTKVETESSSELYTNSATIDISGFNLYDYPNSSHDDDVYYLSLCGETQLIKISIYKTLKVIATTTKIDDNKLLTLGALREILYPIGSIYTSMNNVNPSIFIGGTWEQITDKFMYCSNMSLATGGSKKISVVNLPPHTHNYLGYTWQWGQTSSDTTNIYCSASAYAGASNSNYINTNTSTMGKTQSTGSGTDYMPPYITVFAWYRTA